MIRIINAMANLKNSKKIAASKAKALKAQGENAIVQIIQNLAHQSNKQKSQITDHIKDFSNKFGTAEENIELVINELDSFMQQFEDTPRLC